MRVMGSSKLHRYQAKHHERLNNSGICRQPNWAFNVDANMGHAFGIVMAHVGALRPAGSGAS